MERWYVFAFLVAISVTLGDVAFHWFLVDPFETPAYFLAKFGFSFAIGAFLSGAPMLIGATAGALLFTGFMSVYYYAAYASYNPILSSCVVPPTYNCVIKGVSQQIFFHIGGYPVTTVTFIEATIHFLLFFAAFLIWRLVFRD